jgi:hypothetical protein
VALAVEKLIGTHRTRPQCCDLIAACARVQAVRAEVDRTRELKERENAAQVFREGVSAYIKDGPDNYKRKLFLLGAKRKSGELTYEEFEAEFKRITSRTCDEVLRRS